jgi:hypothetical protein
MRDFAWSSAFPWGPMTMIRGFIPLFLGACALLAACDATPEGQPALQASARLSSVNYLAPSSRLSIAVRPAPWQTDPTLRRVTVFVLPGDAIVEVNRRPTFRRNGVIDFVGKVGTTARVRVTKGQHQHAWDVRIEDQGANPQILNMNEHLKKPNASPREQMLAAEEAVKPSHRLPGVATGPRRIFIPAPPDPRFPGGPRRMIEVLVHGP